MVFSDTSTYDGLVQHYERWTRQPRGVVSGDNDLLKAFASDVNSLAFPELMPMLLAYNDQIRWDDLNNTDAPVGYVTLASGQSDYKVTVDDNSMDILNLTGVRIKQSSTDTIYTPLKRLTADDPLAKNAISPDTTSEVGIPQYFLELGNVLYLYPQPNYTASSGIELFFGRQHSYFAYTDTTKEPGIPLTFHALCFLIPALAWNEINRTDDGNLLGSIRARIAQLKSDLQSMINLRNPTNVVLSVAEESYE